MRNVLITICSLPHAAMHVIHLIIFRDFALLMDLSLLFLRIGLHAVYEDELTEFAPKMLSKLSFIISNAASIILDREKGRKWRGKHKQPQITEMPIRTGLILSHDLCVWQNMVGNLRWNFYFTNYGHGRFARD